MVGQQLQSVTGLFYLVVQSIGCLNCAPSLLIRFTKLSLRLSKLQDFSSRLLSGLWLRCHSAVESTSHKPHLSATGTPHQLLCGLLVPLREHSDSRLLDAAVLTWLLNVSQQRTPLDCMVHLKSLCSGKSDSVQRVMHSMKGCPCK